MLAAGRRRLRLAPIFFRDPSEFRSRLAKDLETVTDRLMRRSHRYEVTDWNTLVDEIGLLYVDTPRILGEPTLETIESDVGAAIARTRLGTTSSVRYNADFGVARCAYLICRLLRPTLVVETGVANGVTTAFILQALAKNGHGVLHSIDLPPLGRHMDDPAGGLIPDRLRGRWQLHVGTSRNELPRLVAGDTVDVFLHDSAHTYRTMSWEFATVWPRLRSGGVLLSDDVQNNRAFDQVRTQGVGFWRVVRERDKPFLFGIAIKR